MSFFKHKTALVEPDAALPGRPEPTFAVPAKNIVLGTPQACAPTSFPVIPSMIDCSTVGKNPQTYRTNQGVFKYLSKKHKGDLHGPFIKSSDSPDAMPEKS